MTMPYQSKGPSLAFIGLAVIILLAGIAAFVALLLSGIFGIGKELTQVVVPGEKKLALVKPGKYNIFHEYRSVIGNKVYSGSGNISELTVTVTAEDGTELSVTPDLSNSNYNLSGRSGRGLFVFEVKQPGTYTLSAAYPPGIEGSEAVLAVGHDFMGQLMVTIFSAIGSLFGGIVLFVLILLFTLIGRAKARQKAVASGVPFNPIGPQG